MVGLYQILNPKSDKLRGYNVYHIAVLLVTSYICLISAILCVNGVNYWRYHKVDSSLYFGTAGYSLFTCYKMGRIVRHSDRLWKCLAITRLDLTSCGGHSMEDCRKTTILYTYTIATFTTFSLICFVACPFIFGDTTFTMTDYNGSTGTYRLNMFNGYTFISDEIYNGFFAIFYAVETVYAVTVVVFINIYDILIVTLCLAISGQLRTVSYAFASVGHDDLQHLRAPRSSSKLRVAPFTVSECRYKIT